MQGASRFNFSTSSKSSHPQPTLPASSSPKTANFTTPLDARRRRTRRAALVAARAAGADAPMGRTAQDAPPVHFPRSYLELYSQCKASLTAAAADGVLLCEVQFPPCGLDSVGGDSEGNVENDFSTLHTREIVCFRRGADLQRTRVLFPDALEAQLAVGGVSRSNDGVPAPKSAPGPFRDFPGRLGHLYEPSVWTTSGLSRLFNKHPAASQRTAADDACFVATYPCGNLDEMLELSELHRDRPNVPIVVVNGELERIRSGYYPSFWARREMEPLRAWVPRFCQTYLIHNFKGTNPAVLFRAYPHPFQVLVRAGEGFICVHECREYPGLRAVAADILPAALARLRRDARRT